MGMTILIVVNMSLAIFGVVLCLHARWQYGEVKQLLDEFKRLREVKEWLNPKGRDLS